MARSASTWVNTSAGAPSITSLPSFMTMSRSASMRLVHMVGDEHHGDAPLPVEPCGWRRAPRAARQGPAWRWPRPARCTPAPWRCTPAMATRCFCPPERRWGAWRVNSAMPTAASASSTRRRISSAGNAQILRGEGHVLLHHVGNDLVIRVLEHHAHAAADLQQQGLVRWCPCPLHTPCRRWAAARRSYAWPGWICRSRYGPAPPRSCPFQWTAITSSSATVEVCPLLRRIGEGEMLGLQHC